MINWGEHTTWTGTWVNGNIVKEWVHTFPLILGCKKLCFQGFFFLLKNQPLLFFLFFPADCRKCLTAPVSKEKENSAMCKGLRGKGSRHYQCSFPFLVHFTDLLLLISLLYGVCVCVCFGSLVFASCLLTTLPCCSHGRLWENQQCVLTLGTCVEVTFLLQRQWMMWSSDSQVWKTRKAQPLSDSSKKGNPGKKSSNKSKKQEEKCLKAFIVLANSIIMNVS